MVNLIFPSRYRIERKKIKQAVSQILVKRKLTAYQINIIFVGRKKMKQIASRYKNENEALPILSFLYNEKYNDKLLLGEIFICYPQAVIIAAQRNKKVSDIIIELINHGIETLTANL